MQQIIKYKILSSGSGGQDGAQMRNSRGLLMKLMFTMCKVKHAEWFSIGTRYWYGLIKKNIINKYQLCQNFDFIQPYLFMQEIILVLFSKLGFLIP